MKELNYKNLFVQTLLVCLLLFGLLVYMATKFHKVSLEYEITQYQLEQLVESNKNNSELLLAVKSLLPCSFVYRSYISMSYEALRNMYHDRKNHRLPYWKIFLNSFKDLKGWKEYVL